jgi:hypothetical protein
MMNTITVHWNDRTRNLRRCYDTMVRCSSTIHTCFYLTFGMYRSTIMRLYPSTCRHGFHRMHDTVSSHPAFVKRLHTSSGRLLSMLARPHIYFGRAHMLLRRVRCASTAHWKVSGSQRKTCVTSLVPVSSSMF